MNNASNSDILELYHQAKASHPDMVLLIRMGDEYALFGDDAALAGRVLGLACQDGKVSFPQHALERSLQRLLREGHRVALCEQVK